MNRWIAVLLLALALALAGCRNPDAEKAVSRVVQDTVTALAAKDYAKAKVNLTGEALSAIETLGPVLEPVKTDTRVSDFRVASSRVDGQEADVRAQWVQEQAVTGYGSSVQAYDVRFHLINLKGEWRIAYAHVLQKED